MRTFALLALCAAAAAAQTRVDLADEADLHFQLGTEAFRAHDYRSALEHFLASNRLVPNRNVVFDIAETYAQLRQYPDAYRYYTQALEAEPDAAEQARIRKSLQRVAHGVAVLRVRTEPPGATLYVDRKDLGARGQSPAVLAFAPGRYRVLAELPGYEPASSAEIDAPAGSDVPVELSLRRIVRPVRIAGQPAGATVSADSGERCSLPCELSVPPGKVELTAQADGFSRARQTIYVPDTGTAQAEFELQPLTGKLVINTDERGAAVQIDGRLAGFTPAVLDAPVGARHLRITLPGFAPVERTVNVQHGEQPPIDVQLVAVEDVQAASRTSESVDDAPSSVTIISGRELRAMGYPTIAEALRGVRGVFVSDDTTYASLGFRGYGPAGSYGNKVLVLVDGHSTNDDWIGSSYVGYDNRTDLDGIDRIEIVRGPGSVLYGTGAFVGVVNLVTTPNDAPSDTSVAMGTSEGGSLRARGRVRRAFGGGGFDLAASGLSAAGQDYFFSGAGDSRGADGFRSGTASGKLWWGAFTLQAQAVARDKALPSGEYETALGDAGTHLIDRRAFAEARFEPKLGDAGELFLRGYFDRYTYDSSLVSSADISDGLRHERYTGDWMGAEARVVLHPWSSLRLIAGGEWQDHFHVAQRGTSGLDSAVPETYLASENPFQFGAGYADLDLKLLGDRLHLSAGARLDHYSTFGNALNPRVSLIVKPLDATVIKLMAGRAFRAPSIYELYYNDGGISQIPSGGLQPEHVWSGEIELTQHFAQLWTAVASAWASEISDIIQLAGLPSGLDQYQNVSGSLRAVGAEAELRREWRQGWMASATYSFAHWPDTANSPEHMASVKLAAPVVPRALTAMTRLTIETPRKDRTLLAETPWAVVWDVSLSGELPDWHARYSFGVYNLADWKWTVPVSPEFGSLLTVPQRGRTVLGSITLSL